jgi:hypothetical protein
MVLVSTGMKAALVFSPAATAAPALRCMIPWNVPTNRRSVQR